MQDATQKALSDELADCGNINVQTDDVEDTGVQFYVELPRTTAKFTIEGPQPWQEIFLTKREMTALRDALDLVLREWDGALND